MKKPAILAILTLLAPPMMAADDPCNPDTGGTFHSCITFMLQRIGQLEKQVGQLETENQAQQADIQQLTAENQAQQAEIQALEMRLRALTDGLVAYYPFNGDANDASGNGNHGTEHGNITYVQGIVGKALKLNGTDSYIRVANPSQKFGQQYTITGWILTQGRGGALVKKYTWGAPGGGRGFGPSFTTESGSGTGFIGSTLFANPLFNEGWYPSKYPKYTIQIGELTYITTVYDKGNIKIYINGAVEAEKDLQQGDTLNNPYDILIGTYFSHNGKRIVASWTHRTFDGLIDELRIYNRALTDVEIQSLYKQR